MYSKFGQFIDGKWQQAEKKETYEVINPATEEAIGKASKAWPKQATFPCPNIPKVPANKGSFLPSIKIFWDIRYFTIAWAQVSFIFFIIKVIF